MNCGIFKEINGFYGKYQVDPYGNVKSLISGKILKPTVTKCGYQLVILVKDGHKIGKYVHRLVAETFLPNQENFKEINHKDENKTNNFVWVNEDGSVDLEKSNLEWCDRQHNIDAYWNNHRVVKKKKYKKPKCTIIHPHKISAYDKNGNFIKEFKYSTEAERYFGFKRTTIRRAVNKSGINNPAPVGNYVFYLNYL